VVSVRLAGCAGEARIDVSGVPQEAAAAQRRCVVFSAVACLCCTVACWRVFRPGLADPIQRDSRSAAHFRCCWPLRAQLVMSASFRRGVGQDRRAVDAGRREAPGAAQGHRGGGARYCAGISANRQLSAGSRSGWLVAPLLSSACISSANWSSSLCALFRSWRRPDAGRHAQEQECVITICHNAVHSRPPLSPLVCVLGWKRAPRQPRCLALISLIVAYYRRRRPAEGDGLQRQRHGLFEVSSSRCCRLPVSPSLLGVCCCCGPCLGSRDLLPLAARRPAYAVCTIARSSHRSSPFACSSAGT
jgi:hypothetical protein